MVPFHNDIQITPPPHPRPVPKNFFKKEFYWYNDTNKTQMKMYIPILIKGSVV